MKKLILVWIVLVGLCNSYASYAQQVPINTIKKVVIDAGHGGRDPGALSPDKKVREKDVNLAVAKYLGQEIKEKYPSIEVLYTRSSDKAVSLDARGTLATEQHADLFISIHVNSAKKAINGAVGPETWVFGGDRSLRNDASYEVVLKENEVIKFEDDFKTKYENFDPDNPQSMIVFNFQKDAITRQCKILATCVQSALRKGPLRGTSKDRGIKEGGLMVLAYCSMPAILVELGFLNSAADRSVMATDSGRKKLAHSIFLGFEAYRADYEKHNTPIASSAQAATETPPAEAQKPVTKPTDAQKPVAKPAETQKTTDKSTEAQEPTTQKVEAQKPVAKPTETQKPATPSPKKYLVQILASKTEIQPGSRDFKGRQDWECLICTDQPYKYKYYVGSYDTLAQAQQACNALRGSDFPGAFVIAVRDGTLVSVHD